MKVVINALAEDHRTCEMMNRVQELKRAWPEYRTWIVASDGEEVTDLICSRHKFVSITICKTIRELGGRHPLLWRV
jgi:hypothetical protein